MTLLNPAWLSLEQASSYISVGKTVLYALAREGRIPANKVGKKWVFEQSALDDWVRAKKPLGDFFRSGRSRKPTFHNASHRPICLPFQTAGVSGEWTASDYHCHS